MDTKLFSSSPCLRSSAAASGLPVMPSGVIFALAPSSSLGVQFESGSYLVCLGNCFGVWAWPQLPCVLVCQAPLPSACALPLRRAALWLDADTVGLTCLLSARSSVFLSTFLSFVPDSVKLFGVSLTF